VWVTTGFRRTVDIAALEQRRIDDADEARQTRLKDLATHARRNTMAWPDG